MARSVKPWVGKTDDTVPPPRVRLRIFLSHGGRCGITGRPIAPGDAWDLDHTVALVNGGRNEEANLRPVCRDAHKVKTAADSAEKAKVSARAKKHHGIVGKPTVLSGRTREERDADKASRSRAVGAKPSLPPRPLYADVRRPTHG